MSEPSAPLHEVFFSVQGEGLWVGVPQIFVRVGGCDLACWYCDSAAARQAGPEWALELPGQRPRMEPNPVTVHRLLAALEDWLASPDAAPSAYSDWRAAPGRRRRSVRFFAARTAGSRSTKTKATATTLKKASMP